MTAVDVLAERFEANRPHLRAVAYRMLGSTGKIVAIELIADPVRLGQLDLVVLDAGTT